MRVLLSGGTDATIAAGDAIVAAAGARLVGVVTVPREFSISYSTEPVVSARFEPVAEWARERELAVLEYAGDHGQIARFAELHEADFALFVGWYHMVPRRLRNGFAMGCAGMHASLLPTLRGGAPLNWAIISGMTETGVSFFELADGVDDGPLYAQRAFPIAPRASISDLIALSHEAIRMLLTDCLPQIARGSLKPQDQDGAPSYCLQRKPEDGRINWTDPADRIDRLIRAVSHPYPGAYTYLGEVRVLVWRASPSTDGPKVLGVPGQVARLPGSDRPTVVTGDGLILIEDATDSAGRDVVELLLRSGAQRLS